MCCCPLSPLKRATRRDDPPGSGCAKILEPELEKKKSRRGTALEFQPLFGSE